MANKIQFVITAVDRATSTVRKVKASIASTVSPVTDLAKSLGGLSRETGLTRVTRLLVGATRAAGSFAMKLGRIATPLGLLGGIGSAAGIGALVTGWGRAGQELERTSSILGVSTDDLQRYRGVAKLAGLSTESMDSSLAQLGDTMQGAVNGRAPEALALMSAWRIGLHRTASGAVDATRALRDVSQAIQSNIRAGGNVQSARQIASAFGVESLLPLLMQGPGKIQELINQFDKLNASMSGLDAKAAGDYENNLSGLVIQVENLRNALGNALIPVLQPAIQQMSAWLAVPENKDLVISKVAGAVQWLSDTIKNIDWDKAKQGADDLLQLISAAANALREMRGVPDSFERLGNWLRGNGSVTNAQRDAGATRNTAPAIQFFVDHGWSPEQATGVVANLQKESGLDYVAQGDNGQAYGIAQWHKDRQDRFAKWAGKPIQYSSLEDQLGFVNYELTQGTESAAGAALRKAQSPEQAAAIVSRLYERPANADAEAASRAALASSLSGAFGGPARVNTADALSANETEVAAPGQPATAGKVQVDVNIRHNGAATTSVKSSGDVTPSVKTGRSMDLGAPA